MRPEVAAGVVNEVLRNCTIDVRRIELGRAGPEPQKVFDVPGGSGQRAGGDTQYAQTESRGLAGHGPHSLLAQFGAAYDPSAAEALLADFELRLDHQHQIGVRGRAPDERRQDEAQRNEGEISHHQVHRLTVDRAERQLAHIRTVFDLHAFITLQRPGELSVSDVHRDHLADARTQQDVGESPGRRSRVQGPPSLDPQTQRYEGRQRPGEFVPTA